MFETVWKDLRKYSLEKSVRGAASRLSPDQVESASVLEWDEHCLECAIPLCYRECLKYLPRIDGKCRRFTYGMVENTGFSGLFSYGVDIRFEPWSKLECRFNAMRCGPVTLRGLDTLNRLVSRWAFLASKKSGVFRHGPSSVLARLRGIVLGGIGKLYEARFDSFVMECYSTEPHPFDLRLQCDDEVHVFHSRTFTINPGPNYFEIPYPELNLPPKSAGIRIYLYPERDLPVRLIFTWLDFVVHKKKSTQIKLSANKVKCVAWDLDNTLWKGILIEDGPERIRLDDEALEVIRKLDERGIIHTIVSKNSHDHALKLLEQLGIAEFFIYPAINWGHKSENLKQVADRINIGLDTLAMVDDSPHERAEIAARLPMVRVYSEKRIPSLPELPEFDVPVTEMSRQRRLSYLAEMKREEIKARYSENYGEFLRGLEPRMEIFVPVSDAETLRCYELLQRSNQLNLSAKRYTQDEYKQLLHSKDIICHAFRCWDKFGDYGIVGFLSIILGPTPTIQDLVISCRIAQKHYEHALIYWIAGKMMRDGYSDLRAVLVKTGRNTPLTAVLRDIGFCVTKETDLTTEYLLADLSGIRDEMIVSVSHGEPRPDI